MTGQEGILVRLRRALFPTEEDARIERAARLALLDEHARAVARGRMGGVQKQRNKEAKERAFEKAWSSPEAHVVIAEAEYRARQKKWRERERWEEQRRLSKEEVELEKTKLYVSALENHPEVVDKVVGGIVAALSPRKAEAEARERAGLKPQ